MPAHDKAAATPAGALANALWLDGRVPMAWVLEWGRGGRDPVAAAWDATADVRALLWLLVWVPSRSWRALDRGWYGPVRLERRDDRRGRWKTAAQFHDHSLNYHADKCLARVRKLVVPPTLDDVMARVARPPG